MNDRGVNRHDELAAVALAQDARSSSDGRSLSRYLPGDLPPSRQKRSSGRGSPESIPRGSRGRGSSRERERSYRGGGGGGRSHDTYGGGESRSGGRGGGRDRDFSPPSRGSESGGRGGRGGGRGKPRRGDAGSGSPRGKRQRYAGNEQEAEEEDFDYERFTGEPLHEGHEAFGGAGQAEGPARPPQNPGRGQGAGGGRGGRWVRSLWRGAVKVVSSAPNHVRCTRYIHPIVPVHALHLLPTSVPSAVPRILSVHTSATRESATISAGSLRASSYQPGKGRIVLTCTALFALDRRNTARVKTGRCFASTKTRSNKSLLRMIPHMLPPVPSLCTRCLRAYVP